MTTTFMKSKNHLGMASSTVLDIPAELAFDIFSDFSCHPRVFRMCTRMDLLSGPGWRSAAFKEIARVANHTDAAAFKSNQGPPRSTPVGSRYRAVFAPDGGSTYKTILTITKADTDPKRTCFELSVVFTMAYWTVTATQRFQQFPHSTNTPQDSPNAVGSCWVGTTYALVPNNWQGRIYFWLRAKQLQIDAAQGFQQDMQDLCAEGKRRMNATSIRPSGEKLP